MTMRLQGSERRLGNNDSCWLVTRSPTTILELGTSTAVRIREPQGSWSAQLLFAVPELGPQDPEDGNQVSTDSKHEFSQHPSLSVVVPIVLQEVNFDRCINHFARII